MFRRRPSVSHCDRDSTSFPFDRRPHVMPSTEVVLPVGGCPIKGPFWVPIALSRALDRKIRFCTIAHTPPRFLRSACPAIRASRMPSLLVSRADAGSRVDPAGGGVGETNAGRRRHLRPLRDRSPPRRGGDG